MIQLRNYFQGRLYEEFWIIFTQEFPELIENIRDIVQENDILFQLQKGSRLNENRFAFFTSLYLFAISFAILLVEILVAFVNDFLDGK